MAANQNNPLLIVGSGAMACLFAARFCAVGQSVVMLGSWHAGVEALRQNGVTLVACDGINHTYPVRAITNPEDCLGIQNAVVLVKSWQTERAAAQLETCLSPQGFALTLQNGLGNHEALARALGENRVGLGTMTIGANLVAPGVVQMAGDGIITLGDHPRLPPLIALFEEAGFAVERSSNLDSLLWGKLIVNAAINPLTALFEIANGEIIENPYTRRIMKEVVSEAIEVALAQKIPLPFKDGIAAVETVVRQTAENRSSMLQDIQRGAPTEIDAICGAIMRAGERVGVETPVNRLLWQLIKAKVEI